MQLPFLTKLFARTEKPSLEVTRFSVQPLAQAHGCAKLVTVVGQRKMQVYFAVNDPSLFNAAPDDAFARIVTHFEKLDYRIEQVSLFHRKGKTTVYDHP